MAQVPCQKAAAAITESLFVALPTESQCDLEGTGTGQAVVWSKQAKHLKKIIKPLLKYIFCRIGHQIIQN